MDNELLAEFFRKSRQEGVINLAVGDLNFPSPEKVKEEGKKAIDENFTHYTPSSGIERLKEVAVLDFRKSGIFSASLENTLIGPGSKSLIFLTLFTLLKKAKEVLIPGPFYPSYWQIVKELGGKPILIDTSRTNFELEFNLLEKFFDKKPKILIFNSPHNPTGKIWELNEDLGENIWIIADEAYHQIVFRRKNFKSIASSYLRDKVITIRSLSKTFAMTGWRIGYLTAPLEIVKEIKRVQEFFIGCPSSISQKGALALLGKDPDKKMLKELKRRREILLNWLKEREIEFPYPEGAFYLFPSLPQKVGLASKEFAEILLKEKKIALTPGIAFGPYDNYVRISFGPVCSSKLKEALEKIDDLFFN